MRAIINFDRDPEASIQTGGPQAECDIRGLGAPARGMFDPMSGGQWYLRPTIQDRSPDVVWILTRVRPAQYGGGGHCESVQPATNIVH